MVSGLPKPTGLFELPSFPTVFTQEDLSRMRELEEQRKVMEQVYQNKFSKEAWEGTNWFEKALRTVTPAFLTGAVKTLTPWEQGAWDYGFTPEQFQTQLKDVETEYKELVRKQKVTELLPDIGAGLIISALQGTPILDLSELLSTFPELRSDFTQEEIDYLSLTAERIAKANPADILTGKAFEDIAQEDLEMLMRKESMDNRFLLSTVAFSRDLGSIRDALQKAYPPEVKVQEADEAIRRQLIDYYRQQAIDLGIITPDEEFNKDVLAKVHKQIADKAGEVLIITDNKTGNISQAILREDNIVWAGGEIVGSYDRESGNIYPIDNLGNPLTTEREQENFFKDMWDSFFFGMFQAKQSFLSGLESLKIQALGGVGNLEASLPESDFKLTEEQWSQLIDERPWISGGAPARYLSPLAQEKWKKIKKTAATPEEAVKNMKVWLTEATAIREQTNRELLANFNARQQELVNWYAEHPDMLPDPKYNESPFDNPSLFLDPRWWMHTILSNTPITVAALGTGIVVGVASGNPVLGAVAGATVMTPVEIGNLYEDLISNGASPVNASELSSGIGTVIGAIEVVPEFIMLKAMSPMFMKLLRRNITSSLVTNLPKSLGVKGILTTAGKIEISETLEEITQEIIHNVAVKTVNENQDIFANLDQVTIQTLVATLPFAIGGAGSEYTATKIRLPSEVQEKIESTKKRLVNAGLREEHAEAIAFVSATATETGQAQKSEAYEKALESKQSSEALQLMEDRLATYNEDISNVAASLAVQKERLDKLSPLERDEQLETIKNLEKTLEDLARARDKFQARVEAYRKKVEEGTTNVWDSLTAEERTALADEAGIAKTAAKLKWSELTDVQQSKITSTGKLMETGKPLTEKETPQEIPDTPVKEAPNPRVLSPFVVEDPLVSTRRPRVMDWEDEQSLITEASSNPKVVSSFRISSKVRELKLAAMDALDNAQSKYEEARNNEDSDAVEEAESVLKDIATQAGLGRKALLGKKWEDLAPDEQLALSISVLPNGSIKFGGVKEFFDVEYYMEFLEELTGAPFYSVYRRLSQSAATAETAKERVMFRITQDPYYKDIRTDEKALGRVAQEINSRNKAQGIERPTDITPAELEMADLIEAIYNYYKPIVRYLRFMRVQPDIEELKKEFPDAVEAGKEQELAIALELRNKGNLDDLYSYLYNLDWGVINHGFDPRLIANPNLIVTQRGGLKASRGQGRLLRRESIDYPEGKMAMNVLLRLATYVEQMEIQWRIEPGLEIFDKYWSLVAPKFESMNTVKKSLETWVRRLQRMSLGFNYFDRFARKIWRQAMAAVFINPYLAFRNSIQPLFLHPDRTELFKFMSQGDIPSAVKEKRKLIFDTYVSQLGGLRKDFMHVGERGFLVPEWWNRMADRLSLYGWSDYFPRYGSFVASFNKAYRATRDYREHGDIKKWIKDSGAIRLRDTERNYILSHYLTNLDQTFDQGVGGLRELTGEEMVSSYIGQRITDMTHFKYRRDERGIMEQGATGSTLWNLIVFPRGYAQRLYFQAEKIKNTFKGDTTWQEARSGFNDIMKLVVAAALLGNLLSVVTNRKYNPYDPIHILFGWTFGGLFIGSVVDATKMLVDVFTAINPFAEAETRNEALKRIPQQLEANADTLIPFYNRALDIIEAGLGMEHIDRAAWKQLVALVDPKYKPEELEVFDASLWERIRKAILGGKFTELTALQESMKRIDDAEANLGTRQIPGRYFTLGDFAGVMDTEFRNIPDALIDAQEGFSELSLFYQECRVQWADLFKLPSDKRSAWRSEHPLEEAMLLFWEKYDKSVFTANSDEGKEVLSLLSFWFDKYEIDKYKHSHWANWELPSKPLTIE